MKSLSNILNNQLKEIKEISLQREQEKEKINKTKKIKAKNLDEKEYFKKLDDKNKELLELLGNALYYSQNLSKNEAKNFEKIIKI